MKEREENEEKPYEDINRCESGKYREQEFGIDKTN